MNKFWVIGIIMLMVTIVGAMADNPEFVVGTNVTNVTSTPVWNHTLVTMYANFTDDVNLSMGYITVWNSSGVFSNGSASSTTCATADSDCRFENEVTLGVAGVYSLVIYVNDTEDGWNHSDACNISVTTYSTPFTETYDITTCPIDDTPTVILYCFIGVLLIVMFVIGEWTRVPIFNILTGLGMLFYSFPLYSCNTIYGVTITVMAIMVMGYAAFWKWR